MTIQKPLAELDINAMKSDELVQALKDGYELGELKIGFLANLTGFKSDVTHVIYFVRERKVSSDGFQVGDCVCMVLSQSKTITFEMSKSLCRFWDYWQLTENIPFSKMPDAVSEIAHFLKHRKLKTRRLYIFRDGKRNGRLHRAMRSSEKCRQLTSVFNYNLLASEL
ncbi:hypothetical protein ACFL22_00805 [Patescibacteria group bacterium]